IQEEELDYSSRLPDELVVKVLSSLSFKEAARTSVISKRWINLWKSTDLVLDFDVIEELKSLFQINDEEAFKRHVVEKSVWFKNWVNVVISQLEQHNNNKDLSSKVTKFRVSFSLTNSCNLEGDIDRWLEFALSNRVESLHLDFREISSMPDYYYFFSEDCSNHIKTPAGLSEIKSLRSLHLSFVQVRDEIVEHMVANCPLLEELVLKNTTINKLRVGGSPHSPPLPLRHLEIKRCPKLVFVEIAYTPSLTRLIYNSCNRVKQFRLSKCSSLVDLTMDCCTNYTKEKFKSLSGCASQLRFLSFKLFPSLFHGFALKYDYQWEDLDMIKTKRESIKVVEFAGFIGYSSEVHFVKYAMDYFVGLERIVIDRGSSPTPIFNDDSIFNYEDYNKFNEDQARVAKEVALDLKSKASPTIEYIVI
ncbi:Putative F-box/LRR-repeat protein At3g28410, partial [Linum perenne]